MILTLLSHVTAVRILLIVGIAFIALPIFFYKLSKSESERLKSARNWAVFLGILMCLPMAYYLYADVKYKLSDFSENDKLYLAAENKNSGAAKRFIMAGADPCGETRYRKAPIQRAVELDDVEMTKLFLNSGANPNYCKNASETLIGTASMHLCEGTMKLLLDAGADPDYKPDEYVPALHLAAVSDKEFNASAVALLINAGADPASHAVRNGRIMLPYRYYYDMHKEKEDFLTEEEEERYQQISEMLYPAYIEWLNEKMANDAASPKS